LYFPRLFTRLHDCIACIAYTECMQYTIRGIPPEVDRALRQRARAEGKSLNEAAIDALAEATGGRHSNKKRRNLRDLVGTWKPDKELKAALADQDKVDPDLWR
jgi:plasmid stability protein